MDNLRERVLTDKGWQGVVPPNDHSNTALILALQERVAHLEKVQAQNYKAINLLLLEKEEQKKEGVEVGNGVKGETVVESKSAKGKGRAV